MELLLLLGLGFLFGRSSRTVAPPVVVDPPTPVVDPPPPPPPAPVRSTSRWTATFAPTLIGTIIRTANGWAATLRTYRVNADSLGEAVLMLTARAQESGQERDIKVATTDGTVVGTAQRYALPDTRWGFRVVVDGETEATGTQPARNLAITELSEALQLIVDLADEENG